MFAIQWIFKTMVRDCEKIDVNCFLTMSRSWTIHWISMTPQRWREPHIDISIFKITLRALYDLKYILDNRHLEIIFLGSYLIIYVYLIHLLNSTNLFMMSLNGKDKKKQNYYTHYKYNCWTGVNKNFMI